MKRETTVWLILMLLGAAGLIGRAAFTSPGMGQEYVQAVSIADGQWTQYQQATLAQYQGAQAADSNQTEFLFSLPRTIGLWIAAFFTLAIFSFLYRDNPFYRVP